SYALTVVFSSLSVVQISLFPFVLFFFLDDPAPTYIYTLSLHDALPIFSRVIRASTIPLNPSAGLTGVAEAPPATAAPGVVGVPRSEEQRLNSSHDQISYAVFCLKKKKKKNNQLHSETKELHAISDRTVP